MRDIIMQIKDLDIFNEIPFLFGSNARMKTIYGLIKPFRWQEIKSSAKQAMN
jgi:hypothetical protein